jgi:hypothetical protein
LAEAWEIYDSGSMMQQMQAEEERRSSAKK